MGKGGRGKAGRKLPGRGRREAWASVAGCQYGNSYQLHGNIEGSETGGDRQLFDVATSKERDGERGRERGEREERERGETEHKQEHLYLDNLKLENINW